ncbi:MAG: hypothetical protein ACLPKB_15550 [Xanthobacteraceae bacterium]
MSAPEMPSAEMPAADVTSTTAKRQGVIDVRRYDYEERDTRRNDDLA